MDFFAITSVGTYPTPTPTSSQRAAYAASYGFLSSLIEAAAALGKGLTKFGQSLKMR